MKACDNRPPIQIKSTLSPFFLSSQTTKLSPLLDKDKWINVERLRWAKAFSIPIAAETPDGFPPSTLACQRALTALTISPHKTKLTSALDAVYATFWIDRKPIQNPEIFITALAKVVGERDAKELFEKGSSPEVKKRLAEATEEAFRDGAFGLPWFVGELIFFFCIPAMLVRADEGTATNAKGEKEGFWGFDHLGQVCDHLGLERPVSGGWKSLL